MTGNAYFTDDGSVTCRHHVITTFYQADGTGQLWACSTCRLRFYPACPTCVDVGHRNEEHVSDPELDVLRTKRDVLGDAYVRLMAERDALLDVADTAGQLVKFLDGHTESLGATGDRLYIELGAALDVAREVAK